MNINPNIFKNNWEALKNRYPDIALKLSTIKIEKYKLVQQSNCIPNVVIDGQFYYVGNIQKYCSEQFKGFKLENTKIPVFLGAGLFYEVIYWLKFKAQEHKTQSIIVIEKDLEMFMCAMNVTDLTSIINNPNIHLFIGVSEDELYVKFREHYANNIQEMLMCGATQPVFLYPAMKIDKEYYLKALQVLFESIYHSIQNHGNCPEDSLIGLENMLDNVNEITSNPGINLLYDKFKDKPAVIVATGPSLKKNMHLLKGLEDKTLILSCDASFKLLMKNGIKPHMVTSLEREHEVQQFFDGFDPEEVKDTYMTACPVLYNHVYESYIGPQIIVYRNFDHFKWLEIDRGILDIKLSSANMAFKIAEAAGCNPIILIGQDLAYGENNETHATEVPFTSEGEGIFYVKGNTQEKVKTNSGWYGFLKAFEVDVNKYNGKVINCTEGGAYILGTEIAGFHETIKEYITENCNPLEIIKENLKQFTHENIENDISKLKNIIKNTEKELNEIINCCEKGMIVCKKYEKDLESDIDIDKMTEIREEIIQPRLDIQVKYGNTFQKFLMHVLQSYHLKFEMECTMTCTEPKELLKKFIEWYCHIGDITSICLQSLMKAKGKIYAERKTD